MARPTAKPSEAILKERDADPRQRPILRSGAQTIYRVSPVPRKSFLVVSGFGQKRELWAFYRLERAHHHAIFDEEESLGELVGVAVAVLWLAFRSKMARAKAYLCTRFQ